MIEKHYLQSVPAFSHRNAAFPSGLIAVTRDAAGIADSMTEQLRALGYEASVVEELPEQCTTAVLLEGLRTFSSQEEAIAVNRRVFMQAKRIAKHFMQQGGYFITVQDTGGQFAFTSTFPHQVWAAGISGLVKTIALEWPSVQAKAIDLQRADQTAQRLATRLVQEILYGGSEQECGLLADGRRMTLKTQCLSASSFYEDSHAYRPGASSLQNSYCHPLNKQAVCLVTGGGRGITAACLLALADHVPLRFVLLGRTDIQVEPTWTQTAKTEIELKKTLFDHYTTKKVSTTPQQINQESQHILAMREILHVQNSLIAKGSEVHYQSIDILDAASVQQVLSQVRSKWGEISALIHGAGVLADKWIVDKTQEQFDKVFNTKVLGLKNLLAHTAEDPLTLMVFFSSVAARYGNKGQCDYAMANEVLNKVAQQQQRIRKDCRVKAINWGPWESGMVTAELKKQFVQRGITVLSIKEGSQQFVEEAYLNSVPAVEVVIGGNAAEQTQHTKSNAIAKSSDASDNRAPFMVMVDAQSHPYLKDHAIEGVPVLPASVALTWFVQAVEPYCSDFTELVGYDFQVLKGIRLHHFYQQPQKFLIHCEQTSECFKLSLSSGENLHYRATLAEDKEKNNCLITTKIHFNQPMQPWPLRLVDIYNPGIPSHALFYGRAFQNIHRFGVVCDNGGTAELLGVNHHDAAFANSKTDFMVIDAALQLLLFWGVCVSGRFSLPMRINSFRIFSKRSATGIIYCTFDSHIKNNYSSLSNVILKDDRGEVYAMLLGVEMVFYR